MNDTMYEVTSQSKANWRTRRHLTSQGDIYPIGEVEAGFGIEALMAGPGMEGEGSGEDSGDPEVLSGGGLRCGTAMVCTLSYVGKCLWINPSGFQMWAYCGCDTTLVGEALRLPSELAGDGGSSEMLTSIGGRWLGTMGYVLKRVGGGDGT